MFFMSVNSTEESIKSNEKTKEININPNPEQQAEQQPQEINLNDIVLDLKVLSDLAFKKVSEYSDISSNFKQIHQVTQNLALALSTYLEQKGELDHSRFKLVK